MVTIFQIPANQTTCPQWWCYCFLFIEDEDEQMRTAKNCSLKFSFNKKWPENVFAFHDNFMNIEKVFPRQLFSASCHQSSHACTYIEHVCFFSHTRFMCGSTALWKFKSSIGVESLNYLKQPLAKSWVNFVFNFSNLSGFHSHNLYRL